LQQKYQQQNILQQKKPVTPTTQTHSGASLDSSMQWPESSHSMHVMVWSSATDFWQHFPSDPSSRVAHRPELQSSDFVQNDPEVCPQVRVAMDNKTNATTRAGERLEDFMRIGGGAMQWSKNDNFMSQFYVTLVTQEDPKI
jgi:hypothetical protein